jgi:PII-like signaling protein
MAAIDEARLLRIHIHEQDRSGDRPLYAALVQRCRELGLAGATVLKGVEGYGETALIHRRHMLGSDQPVIVIVVDTPDNIARALPALEELVGSGLIAISRVLMNRVRAGPLS